MIRVIVIDDHALVRQGFVRLINAADGMTVCAEAGSGEEGDNCIAVGFGSGKLLEQSEPPASGLGAGDGEFEGGLAAGVAEDINLAKRCASWRLPLQLHESGLGVCLLPN